MSSLLGDLDGQASVVKKTETPRPKAMPTRVSKTSLSSFKRKAEDSAESPLRASSSRTSEIASDPVSDPAFGLTPSSDGYENGTKKARFESSVGAPNNGMDEVLFNDGPGPEAKVFGDSKRDSGDVKMEVRGGDDGDGDDDLFVKPSAPTAKPKGTARRELVNASSAKPKLPKAEPADEKLPESPSTRFETKPKPKGLDWRTATSNLASLAPIAPSSSNENELNVDEQANFNAQHQTVVGKNASKALATVTNALEPDGSLQFWWFDYDEPASQPGTVRLIGKVRAKGETVKVFSDGEKVVQKYVSAVLTVRGIKRKLFVLPKTKAECGSSPVLDPQARSVRLTHSSRPAQTTEPTEAMPETTAMTKTANFRRMKLEPTSATMRRSMVRLDWSLPRTTSRGGTCLESRGSQERKRTGSKFPLISQVSLPFLPLVEAFPRVPR